MRELFLACVGFFVQMAVFFCAGGLLMRGLKMKEEASMALLLGYFVYFAVFDLIAVPMTLARLPLHVLTAAWAVLLAALVCAAMLLLRKQWRAQLGNTGGICREHSFMLILFLGVIVLQCAVVALYQDTTVDAAYYVGLTNSSVYSDTLGLINPYTGGRYHFFRARYVYSAYPLHNAVWCCLTGMHALVQSKVVMSAVNVIMANIVIYQLGKRLFHGGKRQADLFGCFVCVMQLYSYTIYTAGTFFFTRSYEGKSILANVSVPMALLCVFWFWQELESRNVWTVLFIVSLATVTFSGSAFIFPAVISAGMLPVIILKRRWNRLLPYVLSMLPCAAFMLLYLAEGLFGFYWRAL